MWSGGNIDEEFAWRPEAAALLIQARAALAAQNWAEALELASQALSADPSLDDAAAVIGIARHRLGALTPGSVRLSQLTVVAVDMCESTAIAAAIGPERSRELMMELYGLCVDALGRYDGRVVKYGGDGVLAQFGHPIAHEDDGRRAVLGALAILDEVRRRWPRWEQRYGARARVRIGLDTGTVAVGPVDATPWASDEIAGDPPNIASRVQALAEPMTVQITEATRRLTIGWFETEPIGPVELRNYPRPVRLHRVLRPTEAENRLEASAEAHPRLVDRVEPVATLRRVWTEVGDTGQRRIVGLVGPAGIGKSRLGGHLVATAVASGATPITLACSALHRASPLRPVTRALRRLFQITPAASAASVPAAVRDQLERLPELRSPVERAVPVLAWILGYPSGLDLPPDELRRRAFDAVIDLFEAVAAQAPVVLHVDDVHAADPSTTELLLALSTRPPAAPILVVLAGRTLPDLIERDVTIELTGLEDTDAAKLARAVAADLDDETVARIVRRCDGLPFYLEELARSAAETGGEVVTEVVELTAFVAARLDELGEPLRRLAGQVAIAGHQVDLDVLGQLTELSPEPLAVRVAELVGRAVLRRGQGSRGPVVSFRHDVAREVAYQTLLGTYRGEQHLRLARIMAELPHPVRPDDLAGHWTLGGEHARALACWLTAARSAAAAGARREAIALYGHALTAIDQLPAAPALTGAELEAQLGLGIAQSTIEGYTSPNARAAFERAMALTETMTDSTAIFPALWGIWSYWFVLGEHRLASPPVERCLAIANQEPDDPRYRWFAAAMLGYERFYTGDLDVACAELALAAEHAGVEPVADFPHDSGVISHATLSVALLLRGEPERGAEVAKAAAAQAEAMDPTGGRTALTQAWVGCWMAMHAELSGDPATALELAERAEALAAEHGYATWHAAAIQHRAIALCSLGRLEEGLPLLTAMVDAWQSVGRGPDGDQRHPVLMTPYYAGKLARARLAAGDHAGAADLVDRLLAATAANGEHVWDGQLHELRRTLEALS
jgi:class 3 adenylate cyclase